MTSSGISDWFLDNSSVLLEAFDRVGIRPSAITREQLKSGTRSLNLELAAYSNIGPNLWKITLESIVLTQGTATYSVPNDTVSVLDVYIRTEQSGQDPIDRLILPISRTDYANQPNKEQQAPPTSFWFDRLENPTITLWPVPDQDSTYTLYYYRMKRVENANITGGETPDVPFRFLDALCAGVAARLAQKYQPTAYAQLKQEAQEALTLATVEDREMVDLMILPILSGYWNM